MEPLEEFVDERQKAWCIHCARTLTAQNATADHVPTKGLLFKPRPHHLPVVMVCRECNNGFSLDEQYVVTFLSCVLSGTTDPEKQVNPSAARAMAKRPPFQALMDRASVEYQTLGGDTRIFWKPDMGRINRVVLKNARGHIYFEFGEPVLKPESWVWAMPLVCMTDDQRNAFEGVGEAAGLEAWPEVGSRMMTRLVTGQDMRGTWVVVQDGLYRYSVRQVDGGLQVRSVLADYLATEVYWIA